MLGNFGLISFKADGERCQHAGERAAFYALTWHGTIVDYFNTLQALQLACLSCRDCIAELEVCDYVTSEIRLAA